MIIQNIEQLQEFKNLYKDKKIKVSFHCEVCGIIYSKRLYAKNFQLECKSCLTKETNRKLYGVDNVFQSNDIKNKIKNYYQENFGVNNPSQIQSVKEKKQQTSLEHFGTASPFQAEAIKEKIKQSCLATLGTEYPLQNKDILEEMKKTNVSRYGSEYIVDAKRTDIINTNIKRYNSPSPFGSKEVQFKAQETIKNVYGVDNISQLEEIKQKKSETLFKNFGVYFTKDLWCSFKYRNINFDSSWELAFYIYCEDHNIQIKREPCYFNYTYNGAVHKYFPDFLLPCGLVEIKGDQFFSGDKMINPTDRILDGLYNAKYNCMVEHNVNIIKGEQIKFFLDYITEQYGRDYLLQFRTNTNTKGNS